NVTFNPNNTFLDLGYAEYPTPGVNAFRWVSTSGSCPVYFVHTCRLYPATYTRRFCMSRRLAIREGKVYPSVRLLSRKNDPSSIAQSVRIRALAAMGFHMVFPSFNAWNSSGFASFPNIMLYPVAGSMVVNRSDRRMSALRF